MAPAGEARETGGILTDIADGAGLVPPIPGWLRTAGHRDRGTFAAALVAFVLQHRKAIDVLPFADLELEVTDETRPGMVLIPHGFGLRHGGQEHGINVNRLTSSAHRDRRAATPLRALPGRGHRRLASVANRAKKTGSWRCYGRSPPSR